MKSLQHTKVNLDHLASPLEELSSEHDKSVNEEEGYSWLLALDEAGEDPYTHEHELPHKPNPKPTQEQTRSSCKIDTTSFFKKSKLTGTPSKKRLSSKLKPNSLPTPLLVFLLVGLLCMGGISAWKLYEQSTQLYMVLDKDDRDSPKSEDTIEKENTSKELLTVYVSGAVKNPDIYQLKDGSRIADAIKAAGGLSEEGTSEGINLAQKIQDGDQIRILTVSEFQTKDSEAHQNAQTETDERSNSQARILEGNSNKSKVNINTASAQELTALPGIGLGTADKIIKYRDSNGRFKHIDDLKKVPGIGEKKYKKLADLIAT